eukprot:403342417
MDNKQSKHNTTTNDFIDSEEVTNNQQNTQQNNQESEEVDEVQSLNELSFQSFREPSSSMKIKELNNKQLNDDIKSDKSNNKSNTTNKSYINIVKIEITDATWIPKTFSTGHRVFIIHTTISRKQYNQHPFTKEVIHRYQSTEPQEQGKVMIERRQILVPSQPGQVTQQTYEVTRRYKDFKNFHTQLLRLYPQCLIPPLPDKSIVDKVKKNDSAFVNERIKELNRFLGDLSRHPVLGQWLELHHEQQSSLYNHYKTLLFEVQYYHRFLKSITAQISLRQDIIQTFTQSLNKITSNKINQEISRIRQITQSHIKEFEGVCERMENDILMGLDQIGQQHCVKEEQIISQVMCEEEEEETKVQVSIGYQNTSKFCTGYQDSEGEDIMKKERIDNNINIQQQFDLDCGQTFQENSTNNKNNQSKRKQSDDLFNLPSPNKPPSNYIDYDYSSDNEEEKKENSPDKNIKKKYDYYDNNYENVLL